MADEKTKDSKTGKQDPEARKSEEQAGKDKASKVAKLTPEEKPQNFPMGIEEEFA